MSLARLTASNCKSLDLHLHSNIHSTLAYLMTYEYVYQDKTKWTTNRSNNAFWFLIDIHSHVDERLLIEQKAKANECRIANIANKKWQKEWAICLFIATR